MKKVLFVLGFLVLLNLACTSVFAEDVVELRMWTHQRHMMELVQDLNEEFNNTIGEELGIKVTLKVVGENADQLFQAAQRNDTGPDIFNVPTGYNGFEAEYNAKAKIYFDELPGFEEWKAQWPAWYWEEGLTTWKGHVYAIPVTVYNARIIYNKDLFESAGLDPEKPPVSYAEVREYAKQITENVPGKYGFAYPGAENWFTNWMPSQLAEANGYPVWFDWNTGRFNMVNFYDFFKLILDIHKDGSLFPGATSLGNDPLRAQFAAGNIGMFMAESWDVGVLNDQFPAECEWGVAVAPTVSGEFEGRTRAMSSPGLWSINGMSQHKEEAWEVVKWYNQYEVRARFYEEGKFIPPDPEVITHATKVPDITGFAAFAETVEDFDYVTGYPQYPGFVNPPENPCDVMSAILSKNGSADDLKAELERVDKLWNDALDEYYEEHPEAERGWNIYPDFNRVTGEKGDPQVSL